MTLRRGKSGSRPERSALQRRMLAAGGAIDDVAAEMQRRWGFRPRTAYRHAHGWSQDEAAARIRHVAAHLQHDHPTATPTPAITGRRVGEYERWPVGGRRPSPYVLAILGLAYGTELDRLIDTADLRAMPPPDAAVVHALIDRQTRVERTRPEAN